MSDSQPSVADRGNELESTVAYDLNPTNIDSNKELDQQPFVH